MEMRLRLPELFDDYQTTPWRVAQASNGRISPNVLYRLRAKGGRVKLFSAELMQALVDVLECHPSELLESEPEPPPKPEKRKR